MNPLVALVVLQLVLLHSVDGREISVNPGHVSSLYAAKMEKNRLVAADVVCVLSMANGKFVSVTESCSVVRRLLQHPPAQDE